MKRLFAIILTMVAVASAAMAQNANRSGFYFEVGAGGYVGKAPRVAIEQTLDHELVLHFADGLGVNFNFGYRARIANHWAYECRATLDSPVKYFTPLLSPKVFPVGFRYTSPELFRNQSLYAYLDLGVLICGDGFVYTIPNVGETDKIKIDDLKMGLAANIGVGWNFTNHLYVGVMFDAQGTLGQIFRINRGRPFWGTLGINIGYRI